MKLLPGHRSNTSVIEANNANLSNPFNFQSLQGFQLQFQLSAPDPLCVLVIVSKLNAMAIARDASNF